MQEVETGVKRPIKLHRRKSPRYLVEEVSYSRSTYILLYCNIDQIQTHIYVYMDRIDIYMA